MSELKLTQFVDIARQQLMKEMIDNRIKDLDNWMQQCDVVWKEQHVLLPYPKYPDYPADDIVLQRAKLLYKINEPINEEEKKEIDEKVNTEPVVVKTEEKVAEVGIIKINTDSEEKNLQNTEGIKTQSILKKIPSSFKFKRKK
jgi:hypothetical protein